TRRVPAMELMRSVRAVGWSARHGAGGGAACAAGGAASRAAAATGGGGRNRRGAGMGGGDPERPAPGPRGGGPLGPAAAERRAEQRREVLERQQRPARGGRGRPHVVLVERARDGAVGAEDAVGRDLVPVLEARVERLRVQAGGAAGQVHLARALHPD